MLCVIDSSAVATVYRYCPLLAAVADTSPWQAGKQVTCTALPQGSHVSLATISAAWAGRLQVLMSIPDFQPSACVEAPATAAEEAAVAILAPSESAATSLGTPQVHVQCATLRGDPFGLAGHPDTCKQTAIRDFRLAPDTCVDAMYTMPHHLHRRVLIASSQRGQCSAGDAVDAKRRAGHMAVKCPAVSPSLSDQATYIWETVAPPIPAAQDRDVARSESDAQRASATQGPGVEQSIVSVQPRVVATSLSPDGSCLAVLSLQPTEAMLHGSIASLVLLDTLTLQSQGVEGRDELRVRPSPCPPS
jgi:hypothetical protein